MTSHPSCERLTLRTKIVTAYFLTWIVTEVMTRLVMQIQSHDDVRPIVNAVAQWMPQARIQKGETPLTLLEFPKIEADSP